LLTLQHSRTFYTVVTASALSYSHILHSYQHDQNLYQKVDESPVQQYIKYQH